MNGITLLFQWAVWRLDCHKLYISYPVISIFSFALFEGKSFHFITRSLKLITQANIYSEKDTIPRILQKKLFSKYFPSRIKPIRRIPEALISTNTMENLLMHLLMHTDSFQIKFEPINQISKPKTILVIVTDRLIKEKQYLNFYQNINLIIGALLRTCPLNANFKFPAIYLLVYDESIVLLLLTFKFTVWQRSNKKLYLLHVCLNNAIFIFSARIIFCLFSAPVK